MCVLRERSEDVADLLRSQPELVVAVIWASVHVLMDLLLYVVLL